MIAPITHPGQREWPEKRASSAARACGGLPADPGDHDSSCEKVESPFVFPLGAFSTSAVNRMCDIPPRHLGQSNSFRQSIVRDDGG